MSQRGGWRTPSIVFVFCVAAAISSPSQTFSTLAYFDYVDGAIPFSPLTQGFDGSLYGTTVQGGNNSVPACNGGCGTAFKVTPSGTLTTLHDFCSQPNCADGFSPIAGLVQATNGNFYGTTNGGGNNGGGTLFEITPAGTLTVLHQFCSLAACADGGAPQGALVQSTDGKFYGTTAGGGAHGSGTVFKITADGTLTTLYSFCSLAACADGINPYRALLQATDGNFYGTTTSGGNKNGGGTLFEITPAGTLTVLHRFCAKAVCADGGAPEGALVQSTDGKFYGTTVGGGAHGLGTVFKITAGGRLTTLYSFCSQTNCSDGTEPQAGLVQATDGNFYGTTAFLGTTGGSCGTSGCGTIFKITPGGTLTTLHIFKGTDGPDGARPIGGLMQATDGNLYGTTAVGGSVTTSCNDGCGTVFKLATGFAPFVNFVRSSGKVGQTAQVLGQGFTGTASVSFNGTPAAFTVESDTYLTATVPAGATTGFVTVTTPGGTLKSNQIFRVTPQVLSFSPTSGTVGASVTITGQSLTGASAVSFGGVLATSFTVNSDTQITGTVPTGAKTGVIAVRTPGGRGQSSTSFTVTP
jgi:uncharacterized repeat protein (TIGR03803 family)